METGLAADEVIERKEQCKFLIVEDVVEKFIFEDDEEDNEEDNEETNVLQVDDELEDANIPPGRLNISWMNEHDPVEENESDIYKKGDWIGNDDVQNYSRETTNMKEETLKSCEKTVEGNIESTVDYIQPFSCGQEEGKAYNAGDLNSSNKIDSTDKDDDKEIKYKGGSDITLEDAETTEIISFKSKCFTKCDEKVSTVKLKLSK